MYPPTLWQHTQCQYFAEPTSQNNLYSFQFFQIYSLQFINLNSIWPAVKIQIFCSLPFNEKGSKASLKWAMVHKVFHWLCKILDKTIQKLACLLHLISNEIPKPRTIQLTCSTRTVKLATLGRCLVTSKMLISPPPLPSHGVLSLQQKSQ